MHPHGSQQAESHEFGSHANDKSMHRTALEKQ
jgi:hypothetical protein